jgi:hypothetical protein
VQAPSSFAPDETRRSPEDCQESGRRFAHEEAEGRHLPRTIRVLHGRSRIFGADPKRKMAIMIRIQRILVPVDFKRLRRLPLLGWPAFFVFGDQWGPFSACVRLAGAANRASRVPPCDAFDTTGRWIARLPKLSRELDLPTMNSRTIHLVSCEVGTHSSNSWQEAI